MRTAAKIDLTNGMVTLDDGSKKTIDNYILELEDRFIKLQEVLLKQEQEIDQLKAREEEHQRLNGELREENKKLKSLCDKYEEEHKTVFEEWKKTINIINELEKWLEEQHQFIIEIPAYTKEISIEHKTMEICYENILDKLQELKGVDKECI